MNSKTISNTYQEQHEAPFNKHLFILMSCAAFLLIGVLLLKNNFSSLAISFFTIAFAIGGYSKVKMDIKKAIETKRFNRGVVELLILLFVFVSHVWIVIPVLLFLGAFEQFLQAGQKINA